MIVDVISLARHPSIARNYFIIKKLRIFDKDNYLRSYSDVRMSGRDPLAHFLMHGRREGRMPTRSVGPAEFMELVGELAALPPSERRNFKGLEDYRERRRQKWFDNRFDLVADRQDGLTDAIRESRRKDFHIIRKSGYFDHLHYAEQTGEAGNEDLHAIAHYVLAGEQAGLKPARWFDPEAYLQSNRDCRTSGRNAFAHFIAGLAGEVSAAPDGQQDLSPEELARTPAFIAALKAFRVSDGEDARQIAAEWKLLSVNAPFDRVWYARSYLEPLGLKADPVLHYVTVGAAKGHLPNAWFNAGAFTDANRNRPMTWRTPFAAYVDAHHRWRAEVLGAGDDAADPALLRFAADMLANGIYSEDDYKRAIEEYRLIARSALFDEDLYLDLNRDITRSAWGSGLGHYVARGASEGRWPNNWFNPQRFRQENRDLPRNANALMGFIGIQAAVTRQLEHDLETALDADARAFLSRLFHSGTLNHQALEQMAGDYALIRKRQVFDSALYRRLNTDLDHTDCPPLHHFVLKGGREGRWPTEWFDINAYVKANPDLDTGRVNPLADYLRKNKTIEATAPSTDDGRDLLAEWRHAIEASGLFDADFYARQIHATDPDVDFIDHYLRFGRIYGLRPRSDFDPRFYQTTYSDCVQAGVEPFAHYVSVGIHERRLTDASGPPADEDTGANRWMKPGAPLREYEEARPVAAPPRVRAFAWYLPQFHPIRENDAWWGKGFTEWTNVGKAMPLFPAHVQPRVPADLGYYDLRIADVMAEQAALARRFGFEGFAVYYYWFAGHRLLERPVDNLLERPDIDFPFFLCWANENWTRRWDGAENEVLMKQEHSSEDDLAMIADIARYMQDPRYVRIGGKPLFVVYRPGLLPEVSRTLARWRAHCREAGIGEIVIGAVVSFGYSSASADGFDLEIEFPPHNLTKLRQVTSDVMSDAKGFSGHVFDYDSYVEEAAKPGRDGTCPQIRGIMPQWDNTARRGQRATIFHGSTPARFQRLFEEITEDTLERNAPDHQVVIVNAWNEWAEGTYMEPDASWGHAYINAASRALTGKRHGRIAILGARRQSLSLETADLEWFDTAGGTGDLTEVPESIAASPIGQMLAMGRQLLDFDLVVTGQAVPDEPDAILSLAHRFYMDEDLGLLMLGTAREPAFEDGRKAILLSELGAQLSARLEDGDSRTCSGVVMRTGVVRPVLAKAPSVLGLWCDDPERTSFLVSSLPVLARSIGYRVAHEENGADD